MTPQRPALAEVLAAMTSESDASWWRMMTTDHETRAVAAGIEWRIADVWAPLRSWRREPETQRSPLRMTTPAEAVEALATARLWPWEPGDDPTRWWCERCEGVGGWYQDDFSPCDRCLRGVAATPTTHDAIVAVTSLGASNVARYVSLANEIAYTAGRKGARVVFRVMERKAIEQWANGSGGRPVGEPPETLDQVACIASSSTKGEQSTRDWQLWSKGWQSATPRWLSWTRADVAAAWPAIRSLTLGEGETPQPTGVHLVELHASRIVLGVESIYSKEGP